MTHWNDGYITDIVYTSNYYRETSPVWLATASLVLGHRPPDLSKPFRYADLGCGHGFTALTVAATCPNAEVWAFDFNPAHVESGRIMAQRAGLTNIRFQEASFADIAAMDDSALPEFDFIVSHGVISWVSPENRNHLLSIIGRRLRPGGLAYLSYNVLTGWAGMVPIQRLIQQLARNSQDRSDVTAGQVLAYLDRLKDGGAAFFPATPEATKRLDEVRRNDTRYVAHELFNADWNPLMFSDVAEAMAAMKCTFIGSATLTENIDSVSVPPGVQTLMADAKTTIMRETLRDFGIAQGFRRDIYRRGAPPLPPFEHQALLNDLELAWTGRQPEDPFTLATAVGTLTGSSDVYKPLLDILVKGPLSIRDVRELEPFAGKPLVELLQAVTLLLAAGYAQPMLPQGGTAAGRDATERLNRVVTNIHVTGAEIPRVVVPITGSALNIDLLETVTIGVILAGHGPDIPTIARHVLAELTSSNRSVQREGKPITDPADALSVVIEIVTTFMTVRLGFWQRLGVLPPPRPVKNPRASR